MLSTLTLISRSGVSSSDFINGTVFNEGGSEGSTFVNFLKEEKEELSSLHSLPPPLPTEIHSFQQLPSSDPIPSLSVPILSAASFLDANRPQTANNSTMSCEESVNEYKLTDSCDNQISSIYDDGIFVTFANASPALRMLYSPSGSRMTDASVDATESCRDSAYTSSHALTSAEFTYFDIAHCDREIPEIFTTYGSAKLISHAPFVATDSYSFHTSTANPGLLSPESAANPGPQALDTSRYSEKALLPPLIGDVESLRLLNETATQHMARYNIAQDRAPIIGQELNFASKVRQQKDTEEHTAPHSDWSISSAGEMILIQLNHVPRATTASSDSPLLPRAAARRSTEILPADQHGIPQQQTQSQHPLAVSATPQHATIDGSQQSEVSPPLYTRSALPVRAKQTYPSSSSGDTLKVELYDHELGPITIRIMPQQDARYLPSFHISAASIEAFEMLTGHFAELSSKDNLSNTGNAASMIDSSTEVVNISISMDLDQHNQQPTQHSQQAQFNSSFAGQALPEIKNISSNLNARIDNSKIIDMLA